MPANASPATTAPEVIGPYRILGRIGSGGMGIVYRARHWVTGQEVALKTVKVPDEAHLASIRREIRALARVRHPGVVRIVSEGVEAGLPWCAMELCEGRSLRQILQESLQSQAISDPRAFQPTRVYRPTDPDPAQAETEAFDRSSPRISGSFPAFPGPRPAGDAGDLAWKLTLLKRLCAPLAYLHGEGIVHCDLKPDNILVRPSGYPVLVDFGLMALFAGKLGRETLDPRLQVVGTAWYMAPEQVSGELFDARVDLYALGCILYEAITGQPPFVGLTPYEVLTQHSSTTAPPPSRLSDGVPPELDALAARLLEKKPRHRIGYAEDVAALLGRMAGAGITVADDRWDAPAPRPYLYRPGFAGRDETMHELRRHIARLRTGAGALTIVGGESGAGKTRLALAVAGESLRLQTPVVTQECPPPSVSRQSGPVDVGGPLRGFGKALEIVADRCRERGASEVERLLGPAGQRATVLAACAPALAGLGEGKAEDLPPDAARVRLLTYLAQTLRELCDREPLLLVIDDLQWADELTLDALAFLVRSKSLDDMPLAILALHRSDDRVERIAALRGLPGVRAFDLGRLDARAVGKQARDMLAMDAVPEGLAEFLARQSEGNPFFVAEYLRTAVAEGLLRRDASGRWQAGESGSTWEGLPTPRSLADLVARRLGGLPRESRRVVEMASVLGREADAATLAAALDVDAASLGEIVEELIVRQVLEEPAPEMLRFVHGKIRDVTYDGIDPAARIALHRRAALALETGEGAREEMLSLLGHHWEEAGDPARARACYLPSARRAAREFRNEEAERLYRACIGLSDPRAIETIRVRYELSHKVLAASGRNVEARALATENLAMAREVGDPRSIALGCSALATTIREVGVPAEAIPLYEESARLFRELSDPNEEAQQLANLGLSHQYLGHMDEALRLYESAVEIARRAGLPAREGACLIHVAAILTEIGRTEESFALYQRCLAIFRELGDLRRQAVTLGNFALHLQEVGELDLAIRHNEETLALNRRIGARLAEAVTIGNLAICVEQQGRTAEARDLYEKALAIHRQIGDRRHEGITLNNLATLHHTLGELDVAEALFAQAMAIHRELGNRRSEGITFGNLGDLRADRGDLEGARKDLAAALAIHDEVDDVVGRGGMLFRMARVDRLMGGTTDDTLAQVDRAETILRQADQKLDLVQCLCERGHQLLARGRSGKDALELARATAERVKLGSGSAPARSIASLARCVDAFEAGAPLEHGEVPGDDGVRG